MFQGMNLPSKFKGDQCGCGYCSTHTTKKKAFNIAQLTSVIAKTDVNESAVAFL